MSVPRSAAGSTSRARRVALAIPGYSAAWIPPVTASVGPGCRPRMTKAGISQGGSTPGTRTQPRVERGRETADRGGLDDGSDLLIHLSPAFAHGQVPPHTAFLLQRLPVESDELVQAADDSLPVSWLPERIHCRLVTVKALAANAFRFSDAHHLGDQVGQHRPAGRVRQHVGDRGVDQGGGKEHRPVAEFPPQETPDVAGGLGGGQHAGAEDFLQAPYPRGDRPIQLAQVQRAGPAVHHPAGLQVIRTEVDKRPDGSRGTDARGDHFLVESVLKGDDEVVRSQERSERVHRGRGVHRLDAQEHSVRDPAAYRLAQRIRGNGGGAHRERLPSLNGQPRGVDRVDVRAIPVHEQDLVPAPDEMRPDRSADRSRADYGEVHLRHLHRAITEAPHRHCEGAVAKQSPTPRRSLRSARDDCNATSQFSRSVVSLLSTPAPACSAPAPLRRAALSLRRSQDQRQPAVPPPGAAEARESPWPDRDRTVPPAYTAPESGSGRAA